MKGEWEWDRDRDKTCVYACGAEKLAQFTCFWPMHFSFEFYAYQIFIKCWDFQNTQFWLVKQDQKVENARIINESKVK